MASASGVLSKFNNDAPTVGTGFTSNTPSGGPIPTTPDNNIAFPGDVSTSANTLGALPITANTIVPTVDISAEVASVTPNTDIALGGTTPASTPDTAIALGGATPAGSSNFKLAQIDDYSQSPRGMTPGGSTPDEGVSVGLNHGLSPQVNNPQVTYTNGGGSTFSLGPTTSVTNMLGNLGNLGSSLNGVQGGFSIGFRKLKRSLADALN